MKSKKANEDSVEVEFCYKIHFVLTTLCKKIMRLTETLTVDHHDFHHQMESDTNKFLRKEVCCVYFAS